jgi:hypothetical protein
MGIGLPMKNHVSTMVPETKFRHVTFVEHATMLCAYLASEVKGNNRTQGSKLKNASRINSWRFKPYSMLHLIDWIFFANAATYPLWTSWSLLPIVAEV